MEKLKGKTILIGREPGQGRLLVALSGGNAAVIPTNVPTSVSRCFVKEGVAHAKISVDQNGNMTLTKMKNVIYVNGSEIATKRVVPTSVIELGEDRFSIKLPVIIETAKKLAGDKVTSPTTQPAVNIRHLEKVWLHYHDSLKQMREKQKKINLIRSGCGIFTMCAMPCIFFLGEIGYALTGVGVIGNLYSFVGLKNDNTSDEQERLAEEFQESYICPNCGKFLGPKSYKLLKKDIVNPKDKKMYCPRGCGAEFIEK